MRQRKLALFDLDNTLLETDSDYEWAQFLIEEIQPYGDCSEHDRQDADNQPTGLEIQLFTTEAQGHRE